MFEAIRQRTWFRGARDEVTRRPRTRVRAWTGRAAMSLETDSAVPTFVITSTRRTRVSEMRLPVRAVRRRLRATLASPAPTSTARRSCEEPTHQHRWSG